MDQTIETKKPKFDWYETDQYIVLAILIKQIKLEKVNIQFEPRRLLFNYHHQLQSEPEKSSDQTLHFKLTLNLNGEIVPSESSWKVSSVKAEIKMRKAVNLRWEKLEVSNNSGEFIAAPMNSLSQECSVPDKTKDKMHSWDQLVKQVEKEDEEEGGVEELFRRIYSSGDENLRRAMNKSFVESNGTVLSTNWNDVSKRKVDMKPPDSCEYRKWDS